MNIQISGGGFTNKGAELMLVTTARKLRNTLLDVNLFTFPKQNDEAHRIAMGIGAVFPPIASSLSIKSKAKHKILCMAGRFMPTKLRYSYGISLLHHMEALIDISGYSLGDGWPIATFVRLVNLTEEFNRRGKPVIFLPQMFGPFEDSHRANLFTRIANAADLLYARDQKSYEWLCRLGIPEGKRRLAPDITIFAEPESGNGQSAPKEPYACLVPNMHMIDRGGWGTKHIDLLAAAGKQLHEHGLKVYVVLHQTAESDVRLGNELAVRLNIADNVFTHDDPLRLKAFIGGSQILIGSRFHSIVAALSQGVPVIAMGWAHKYQGMLDDFGIGEFIFAREQSEQDLTAKLSQLLNPEESTKIRQRLHYAKTEMKTQNDAMWKEVVELLCPRKDIS